MKKELITALATVLTSTMVTIPIQAATPAEGRASGGFIGIPGDLGAQTTEATLQSGQETDPGDITENKALMDAFGGVDKYYASYEQVTPEYFKQKYAEAAELLKDKIDNTNADTIISSAVTAVNSHFNTRWSALGFHEFYSFDQRIYTDYLNTGRMFNGFEPCVLLKTLLKTRGIEGVVVRSNSDSYMYYLSINVGGKHQYVAFGGESAIVYDTTPIDISTQTLSDMYMGAYKEFLE